MTRDTDGNPAVTGLVLAGGDSTRFGERSKALADFNGQPLIAHVVTTLRKATTRPPVIGIRSAATRTDIDPVIDGSVGYVTDAAEFDGPLAGVMAGLEMIDTDWLFVCGCDMPLLSVTAIQWQLEAGIDASADVAAVVIRHPDGPLEPMHTVYRHEALETARETISPSGGVRALFEIIEPIRVLDADETPSSVPLVDSLSNVNTQADLAALRTRSNADLTY